MSKHDEIAKKLAKELGYINYTPHFNTVLKYFRKPEMKKVLMKLIEISSLPLKEVEKDFTLDSSGFSSAMYRQWSKKRNLYFEHRSFKKSHVISGVKTNIITHIEVTDGYASDSAMLETLVTNTHKNFQMR